MSAAKFILWVAGASLIFFAAVYGLTMLLVIGFVWGLLP